MDWKYRHDKRDDNTWHQQFFNHLRQGAGLICHWQKPCQAILEFLAILTVIFFVSFVVPLIMWMSLAFPLAFVLDYLFGGILRGGIPPCPEVVRKNPNITMEQCREERRSSDAIFHRFALFMTPILVAFICYVLKGIFPKARGFLKFFSTFCVAFFGMVFFPWFINEFLRLIPTWMKLLILVPLFFLWISFPLIRSSTTLMTGIYVCSFVIYWRVYKESAVGVGYDEKKFNLLLGIATLLQWIAPLLVTMQQRLGHVYVR